jgi:hypothetical protein
MRFPGGCSDNAKPSLVAARWLSSRRQTLLSIVVAVILVFSVIALLKVNSGTKQAPAGELLTGSIPRSSAVRKSPYNDSMAAFLALDSNQPAIKPMQRAVDRAIPMRSATISSSAVFAPSSRRNQTAPRPSATTSRFTGRTPNMCPSHARKIRC